MSGPKTTAGVLSMILCALSAQAQSIFVSTNGAHSSPFASWADAATNINEAVALANSLVRNVEVSNGVYSVTNTLLLDAAYTLASVNGPDVTTVYRDNSAGSMFVLAVSNAGASAAGFTVTNGLYSGYAGVGARLHSGTISNCVFTRNQGGAIGTTALLISGGLMTHCVISNNTHYSGPVDMSGGILQDSIITASTAVDWGGVRMNNASALVQRCIFRNLNVDYSTDPIVILSAGAMVNCLIRDCTSQGSAGRAVNISGGRLVNCTITRNTSFSSTVAGVNRTGGVITNCIIYANGNNTAEANYSGTVAGVVYNSCSPALTAGVQGNIVDDPRFTNPAGGDLTLQLGSPCRDSGINISEVADDISGTVRPLESGAGTGARHDMGCYEMDGTTGSFAVGFYGVAPLSGQSPLTVAFHANAVGTDRTVSWYGWDFDNDGTYETNGAGLATVTNAFSPGLHSISLLASNSVGAAAASTNLNYVSVVGTELYVAAGGNSQFPYANWADAATNIHDAVGIAVNGCTVYLGAGNFAATQQVQLTQGIRVLGSGPASTTVRRHAAAGSFGVFYLNHANAFVSGLTVSNGYGSSANAAAFRIDAGAVSNCIATLNNSGSGFWVPVTVASGARMVFSAVSNNTTYSGGCSVSGGGLIEDCLIMKNSGTDLGGLLLTGTGRRLRIIENRAHGAFGPSGVRVNGGHLENSVVYSNTFSTDSSYAAGVYMSAGSMVNCTVAGNIADPASTNGSGVQRSSGSITNCIIYANSGANGSNYVGAVSASWYSCAPELTDGVQGNITNNPQFIDLDASDFQLGPNSPCRDSGINLWWTTSDIDLAGNRRLKSGTVDMGCYELQPPSGMLLILR